MQPGFPGQLCPGSGSGHGIGNPKSEHFFGAHTPSGHSTHRSLRLHFFAEECKSYCQFVIEMSSLQQSKI